MRKIISILVLLVPVFLRAQNLYTVEQKKEPVRMGNKFVFLRDASGKLSFDEAARSQKFEANNDDVPNYDVTTDAIWGKAKLTCKENADWYLAFDPGSFNKITFYQKRGNGQWQIQEEGSKVPKDGTSITTNHIALKLDLKPGDTTTVLFMLHDYYPLQLDIRVGTLDTFIEPFQDTDMYNALCFGVMLMMLIYNWYLFVTHRQRIYLYYLLYVFCNAIFLAVFAGYFAHLPGFIQSIVAFDPVLFPVTFGICILLFTIQLFKGLLSKFRVNFIYTFCVIVSLDAVVGALGFNYLAFNAIRVMGLLLSTLCITTGIVAYRKGSSSAMLYILGFGAYMSGLTFLIISGHLIPANSVALMSVITGSMLECVFLSFAQADKLKVYQLEKEKAQQETLVQFQENEKLVREQNVVLERKVKERTTELAEKNKEILDSIHYAERIQSTLLAHENLLMQNIPDHFILFKPKDIVSGDFYWASQHGNRFYMAICDSTGHGVPGAFMSLLNISFLNEAINEKGIEKPNEVFNYVRTHLINSISRDGGRDGMDGILACIEKNGDSAKVTYAAANNDPLLIRNGEMIELPADKMPVGQGERMDSFTLNEVKLQKGDMLYLFTDGYADQFGGIKGKKFKYKQLQEKLMSVTTKPLLEQRKELDEIFETWKGNLEQIDDVLVFGVKV